MKNFCGIGLRRFKNSLLDKDNSPSRVLDVTYFWLVDNQEEIDIVLDNLDSGVNGLTEEMMGHQIDILEQQKQLPFSERLDSVIHTLKKLKEDLSSQSKDNYHGFDVVYYRLDDLTKSVEGVEDAFFRLQLISHRMLKPHELSLDGLFAKLENLAWSNYGPILPEDVETEKIKKFTNQVPLSITHVDKFPYLVNYHIPSGVRVVDGSKVRLGAYLGEGCTVMPAGYVNFNAGAEGPAMIEGRISAGVMVGKSSDVGGGGSIMGTLSGGNNHVITVGAQCLIGANAGTGISLGFGCTIAAGVYVTAASKVSLYNSDKQPINLEGEVVQEGKNMVKGMELSGKDHLLFLNDSSDGRLKCFPNKKTIKLNDSLHSFN